MTNTHIIVVYASCVQSKKNCSVSRFLMHAMAIHKSLLCYVHTSYMYSENVYKCCVCIIHGQCLDLSYNAVSEEAVLALGTLPELRELHITGQQQMHSPAE